MPNLWSSSDVRETPSKLVQIARSGEVLSFTLNNPERGNEVTGAMFEAMMGELGAESARPSARVLRIRARGGAFCTGRERLARDPEAIRAEAARLIDFKRAVRTSSLITVAEVQGNAFGFGFGLAIVCDFVLVDESASLGFPEMRNGLAPAAIMAYLGEYALPRFTFPLVLFGEPIRPQHALQIGLISQVCPQHTVSVEAEALVDRILKLDPAAARRCKEFFLASQNHWFEQNCELAVEALTEATLAATRKQR